MINSYNERSTIYSPDFDFFMQENIPDNFDPLLCPYIQPKFLQWAYQRFHSDDLHLYHGTDTPVDLQALRFGFETFYLYKKYTEYKNIQNSVDFFLLLFS